MKKLTNIYDFYRLSDDQASKYIGQFLTENKRPNCAWYVIHLSNKYENYNKQMGLIYISPILLYKKQYWFRLGAFSPDDLDIDLDFEGKVKLLINLRHKIIRYLSTQKFENSSYKSFLYHIQQKFNNGIIR